MTVRFRWQKEMFVSKLKRNFKKTFSLTLSVFLLGILIFKGLTVRLLYKSFGVKGLAGLLISEPIARAQYVNETLVQNIAGQWRSDSRTDAL
jgi:hypothetical protein